MRTKKSDIGAVRRTRAKESRWRRVVVTLLKPDVLDHYGGGGALNFKFVSFFPST